MTRGMTKCRICGKPVPSIYRQRHEKVMCLRMRKLRGDSDMLFRELPKVNNEVFPADPKQTRLLRFGVEKN